MKKINKPDSQWKKELSEDQYQILRESGTERPFTGQYVNSDEAGMYHCAACGNQLFSSDTKYHSDSGWPSFYDVLEEGNVELKEDHGHGMERTEVVCAKCGGHLGHLFDDGPQKMNGKPCTGLRYCINSAALDFEPKD
jgi:peptide-methionine (R)-S-oxide reductase